MKGKIIFHRGGEKQYFVEGQEVPEAEYRAAFLTARRDRPRTVSHAAWPMVSESGGTHPADVERRREEYKQAGIGAQVLDDGRVQLSDRAQRREWLKFHGYCDRQAGYGD